MMSIVSAQQVCRSEASPVAGSILNSEPSLVWNTPVWDDCDRAVIVEPVSVPQPLVIQYFPECWLHLNQKPHLLEKPSNPAVDRAWDPKNALIRVCCLPKYSSNGDNPARLVSTNCASRLVDSKLTANPQWSKRIQHHFQFVHCKCMY